VQIRIRVQIPGERIHRIRLIDRKIAVVVHTITAFRSTRVNIGPLILAIAGITAPAGGRRACDRGHRPIAIAILVAIEIPGRRIHGAVLVHKPITVIVNPITPLGSGRTHCRIPIVAVPVGKGRTTAIYTPRAGPNLADTVRIIIINGSTFVKSPIAVLIYTIQVLVETWSYAGIRIVAVPLQLGQTVPIVIKTLGIVVRHPITIIVKKVADLPRPRKDGGRGIITVSLYLGETVPIIIPIGGPLVCAPIAVVVHLIGYLWSIRMDGAVRIVAVSPRRTVAIAVTIQRGGGQHFIVGFRLTDISVGICGDGQKAVCAGRQRKRTGGGTRKVYRRAAEATVQI
jgi:hypothetical protein